VRIGQTARLLIVTILTSTSSERILVKAPIAIGAIVALGLVASVIRSLFPSHLPGPDAAADMAAYFFIPLAFSFLLSIVFTLIVAFKWRMLSA
jgi:hypothetical protein